MLPDAIDNVLLDVVLRSADDVVDVLDVVLLADVLEDKPVELSKEDGILADDVVLTLVEATEGVVMSELMTDEVLVKLEVRVDVKVLNDDEVVMLTFGGAY